MKRIALTATLLITALWGVAQEPIPNQTFRENYYKFSKYMAVDSALMLPLTDTAFTPFRPALIYQEADSTVYVHNGEIWEPVGAGAADLGNYYTKEQVDSLTSLRDFVNIKHFGAIPNDGISDRIAIQETLDFVEQNGGIAYIPQGRFDIDSTLLIGSNVTLYCDNAAEIFLMDSVNNTMIHNKGYAIPINPLIVDSNITIIGGTWLGNGDNQMHNSPIDGTGVRGMKFGSVKNVRIYDLRIRNTQTYALQFMNWNTVYVDKVEVWQGDVMPETLHNQDGIHFDGPGENAIIVNSLLRCFDDAIAINADDLELETINGDIRNIFIGNMIFDTHKGVRILSGDHVVDNIVIEGLSGKTSGNLLEITSFGLGEGKFGTISVSNVNISVNQEVDQNRAVVTINNNIDNINLTNITIQGSFFNHDAIRFGSDTDIGLLNISNLVIDQSVSNMGSRGLNFTPGSYIDKASVSGYHFKGIGIGGTSVDLQSLEARTFTLSESSVDSANNTIIGNGANIGNLVLRDNFGASNNGISLISSNIDTLHIYGSYFKTQGLAFTADAPSTVGLIKTTLLGQNNASNQSSFDVLKYKKAGVVYEVNPGPGDLSNYVTTNTNQTINGTKTFTNPVSSTSFVATGAAISDGMNIISGSNNSGGMVAISGNETKAAAFLSSDNSFVVGYGTVTPGQHSDKFSIDLPTGNATFAGTVSGAQAVNGSDFITLSQANGLYLLTSSASSQEVTGPVVFSGNPQVPLTPASSNSAIAKGYLDNTLTSYALDNSVVKLTGNQNIFGEKTFEGTVRHYGGLILENEPISDKMAATKKYVDDAIAEIDVGDTISAGFGLTKSGNVIKFGTTTSTGGIDFHYPNISSGEAISLGNLNASAQPAVGVIRHTDGIGEAVMLSGVHSTGSSSGIGVRSSSINMPTSSMYVINNSSVKSEITVEPGSVTIDNADMEVGGEVTATEFYRTSSRKIKKDIAPFSENATSILNGVDVVEYKLKKGPDYKKIGFIAEDTHEYLATPEHNVMDQGSTIGLLIKAVQELSAKVEELERRLAECQE